MSSKSVYGNASYINFRVSLFTFPMFVAVYPLIYTVPTTFIIFKTIKMFMKDVLNDRKRVGLAPQMFLVITLSHTMNLLRFLLDTVANRIPATGLITPWCARGNHETILISILILNYYVCYISLTFPFVVSVMRLVYMLFPWTNEKINARLLRVYLPLAFLSPVLSTFWMFPAKGECRQLWSPYPFGSVFIEHTNEYARLKNSPFFIGNLVFWLGITVLVNVLVIGRLLKTRSKTGLTVQNQSQKRKTAEVSLTLTIASMVVSCGMSATCTVIYLYFPKISSYLAIIRSLGSDCDVIIPPWVFYLTHPTFRKKQLGTPFKTGHLPVTSCSQKLS